MNYKRRDFLKLTSGLAFAGLVRNNFFPLNEDDKKIKTFGLQLYTLRDDMLKDPGGVLKQVADAGYKFVESFEGDKGIFWGMTHKDFKKYMNDLGMQIIVSHCNIYKDFEQKAEQAAAIGMKYLMSSSYGKQKSMDDYKKFAKDFNHCGEVCKKAGIRFAFHGEDSDYETQFGQIPMNFFMQETDTALVDFEMDIGWVVTAKQDPESWLKKYQNRFKLCHIKDRIKGSRERDASCILGEGEIDFPKILKVASSTGMQYYIVEQERYDRTTPLKAIITDAQYMKRLRI